MQECEPRGREPNPESAGPVEAKGHSKQERDLERLTESVSGLTATYFYFNRVLDTIDKEMDARLRSADRGLEDALSQSSMAFERIIQHSGDLVTQVERVATILEAAGQHAVFPNTTTRHEAIDQPLDYSEHGSQLLSELESEFERAHQIVREAQSIAEAWTREGAMRSPLGHEDRLTHHSPASLGSDMRTVMGYFDYLQHRSRGILHAIEARVNHYRA